MKSLHEITNQLLAIFPNMTFGEDNDGQLIIYTDTYLDADEIVRPYVEAD